MILKKQIGLALLLLLFVTTVVAQEQTFDVVSFTKPKGWQQQQNEAGVQLSVADQKTGEYAIAVITKAKVSDANANVNFTISWNNLVKATVTVSEDPIMQPPANENGWNMVSGSANYSSDTNSGVVTLITATGNGKMANLVLMTNTSRFKQAVELFLNSVRITESASVSGNNPGAASNTNSSTGVKINSPLAGKIWEARSMEKHGAAYGDMSGFYTGGFWTYQYKFNADGSYHFVYNAASGLATNPVNVLQYETGTYAVNGNQLTITPVKGVNEEWSVGEVNNGMSAERIRKVLETRIKRLKATARKLEKLSYAFTVEYWQGNNANALCMKHTQPTVREGSPGQNDQSCFFETTADKATRLFLNK